MRPSGKWVVLPSVRVFDDVDADKAHALKPLEEASEIHSAWQEYDRTKDWGKDFDKYLENCEAVESLVDECCDTISAVCNLLAAFGVYDLTEPMRRCRERNAARGRITDGVRADG